LYLCGSFIHAQTLLRCHDHWAGFIETPTGSFTSSGPILALFVFLFWGGSGIWIQGFTLGKQAVYHLSQTSSPFCSVYFGDGIWRTICQDWPWTLILSLSSS
jgi:hypothetical protein